MFAKLQSAASHPALGCLIRGINALLAVLATALLFFIPASLLMLFSIKIVSFVLPLGFVTSHPYTDVLQAIPFLTALGTAMFFVHDTEWGRASWQSVNRDNAGLFTLLFAYLIAHDFYFLLPLQLPKSINDHLWLAFQSHGDPDGDYRFMWSVITFLLFRYLIKSYLIQAFDLDPAVRKSPSVDDDIPDDDIPEFPKRSRLVEL